MRLSRLRFLIKHDLWKLHTFPDYAPNEETGGTMQKGTVKWFNPTKGYGFIKPNGGDRDVFVHISAVERAGLTTLNENQVVEYDLVENRGKTSAENLKVS